MFQAHNCLTAGPSLRVLWDLTLKFFSSKIAIFYTFPKGYLLGQVFSFFNGSFTSAELMTLLRPPNFPHNSVGVVEFEDTASSFL